MRPTDQTSPKVEYLAAAFGIGAPAGAALVVLSWWLLTGTLDPSVARQEWEHLLVLVHILATGLCAPLLIGIAGLNLVARRGWDRTSNG